MEIYENRALLVRTRNPSKYDLIPQQFRFDEDTLAFKWGLDVVRVLKNLGVKNVPSPIFKKYTWPCRYPSIFKHQKETASFLTINRRAFVLSEPGTGKTLSALWALDYLMKLGEVRRALIVCPLSIMQSAWLGDIGRSIIHRSAIVCHHADSERRKEIIRKDYEIVIINYDGIPLVADTIVKDGRFDLIIADEATAMKTSTTRRPSCPVSASRLASMAS